MKEEEEEEEEEESWNQSIKISNVGNIRTVILYNRMLKLKLKLCRGWVE
jgi:hypothetical protein